MNKAHKFLAIAYAAAQLSKDPSTKVGAILLGEQGEGGPWGYNGAPRGCKADEDERFNDRETKYKFVVHAEANAIYAAARTGFRTVGATMYVTHPPCMECAKAIIQAGIIKVIYNEPTAEMFKRWQFSIESALALFHESGVTVEAV